LNKDQLTSRIHALSKESGASFNAILTLYFLESILRRITASDQKDTFIFKGGFLLASSLGLAIRTTKDIDLHLQGISLDPISLENNLQNILRLDLNDQIQYEILGLDPIRETDPYGGIRCKIVCKFENIKQTVSIDFATGDPITPGAIRYPYKTLFSQETLSILSYNLETILAEKLHTVVCRGIANSRSKDFYDIYTIVKLKSDQIDRNYLKIALQRTFEYRKSLFENEQILKLLIEIKEDQLINTRWNAYVNHNSFAEGIQFRDTIQACLDLLEMINND